MRIKLKLKSAQQAADPDGFEIQRQLPGQSWVAAASVGPTIRSYSDSGLSPGTLIGYRVRAYVGGDYSNWISVSGYTDQVSSDPVDPVENFRVGVAGEDAMRVDWDYSGVNHTKFELQIDVGGAGNWGSIKSIASTSRQYTEENLPQETLVKWRIRAVGASASSEWRTTENTTSAPGAVDDLSVRISSISPVGAVLRADGNGTLGKIYAAVRTLGPYADGDQETIKIGGDAAWYDKLDNSWSVAFQVENLNPSTRYYVGVYHESESGEPGKITPTELTTIANPIEVIASGPWIPRERI